MADSCDFKSSLARSTNRKLLGSQSNLAPVGQIHGVYNDLYPSDMQETVESVYPGKNNEREQREKIVKKTQGTLQV